MQSKAQFVGGDPLRAAIWEAMKAKASYVMTIAGDEKLFCGLFNEADVINAEDAFAKSKEPAGPFGDPGYQKDGQKRYPLDTEEHIRAAWSYIHVPKNCSKYTPEQCAKIKARIVARWKAVIDPKGPPEAKS